MKKQEKIELAEKCYKQIKDLGLIAAVKGLWIELSPPNKVPTDLLVDMGRCDSKLLVELIENNGLHLVK